MHQEVILRTNHIFLTDKHHKTYTVSTQSIRILTLSLFSYSLNKSFLLPVGLSKKLLDEWQTMWTLIWVYVGCSGIEHLGYIWYTYLSLSMLGKITAKFFFFQENRLWHIMQMVSIRHHLHGMSKLFSGKKEKNNIINLSSVGFA